MSETGKIEEIWRKNTGTSGQEVTFPAWFYAKARGPSGPSTIVCSFDGTKPSIWSHWMPAKGFTPPSPPPPIEKRRWRRKSAGPDMPPLPAWFYAWEGMVWRIVYANDLIEVPRVWTHWIAKEKGDEADFLPKIGTDLGCDCDVDPTAPYPRCPHDNRGPEGFPGATGIVNPGGPLDLPGRQKTVGVAGACGGPIWKPTTLETPLAIEILLQAHCSPGPISNPEAPSVQATVAALVMMNAIERTEAPLNRFRTTKLGRAWVEALCRVPIPRQVYLDEQGRELQAR